MTHPLVCMVTVFDALLSSASANVTVDVAPIARNLTQLSSLIARQLDAGAGSRDLVTQVIVTATSVLNIVDCSVS